jgi:ubiquinone/menaquinone biosynthesis C-methylase UbiE
MTMVQAAEDRYSREREAHNKIFAEHTRASAERFYRIIHESRALYEGLIRSRSKGGRALEYGCGMGSHAHFMARNGAARVVGIDISDVAIEKARSASRAEGVENVEYRRMNAEYLEFDDNSFDLICGTAILHHLDLAQAYSELARVLRPGGLAVFMEPLGHNPLINLYRRMTPTLRTVDEHPLMMRDIGDAKKHFRRVTPQHFVLQSLAAVPFHGRKSFRKILHACEAADALLFRCLPFTRRYSWQVILSLEEPLKHGRSSR